MEWLLGAFSLLSVMMIITIELLDVLSFGSSGTMGVATTKERVSVGLASQLHCLQMADFETQFLNWYLPTKKKLYGLSVQVDETAKRQKMCKPTVLKKKMQNRPQINI